MEPRLQALIDRAEILDVLHQYAHASDRSDEARIADTYHPDSFDNHGPYQGDGRTFAKVICDGDVERETMSHLLGQSTIHVDGDAAGAETYFQATIKRSKGDERWIDMMGGRYIDRLERREGKWRVKHRVCTCEWSTTLRVEYDWQRDAGFVCGTQDKTDLSYAVLGLT